ncbi:arylesterase [Methylocaldum szegediense]|uniref:Multifunctional acyl-CoA thioesterase I and protease I and lysophospholipase L1 n=1 Tax=Methylocaldum szegediense TaxID=73780 RepID=A0ABN8XA16_9GAMM|nr:arylesterase [Methylocaldum szegediense]CAI8918006.1 multifunctional acyl-CoA thioesterase I and protease I and lysophospholipase L1 [Methylocaldum szegediense]
MRKFLISFIVFIVLPGLGQAKTVLVLGDSISAGYGLEKINHGWVAMLQEKVRPLGVEIVNASISGETSAGGLARIDSLLKRHQPSVVILELGANDGLRGLSPKQLEANLSEIIIRSKAAGAEVLLLGMMIPPNYGKRYADMFRNVFYRLAETHDTGFVPFLLEGVGGQDHLMQADGLHPNRQAQPMLFRQVWDKLEPMLAR